MKLPLRFRILHLMSEKDSISSDEIMDSLKDEYGGEGQFKKPVIDSHLQSMRAVGLIDVTDVDLDANENLKLRYKITDYGIDRLKYLPDAWKK